MKRKINVLIIMIIIMISINLSNMSNLQIVSAKINKVITEDETEYIDKNDYIGDESEDDDYMAVEFTKYDFNISPYIKKIKKAKSFVINIIPERGYQDLTDDEWKELCEENIDMIVFKSVNSKIATVHRRTGRVTGRNIGSTLIKTTVYLANGEVVSYKTKVYVNK